jgi:hypothetical protein
LEIKTVKNDRENALIVVYNVVNNIIAVFLFNQKTGGKWVAEILLVR